MTNAPRAVREAIQRAEEAHAEAYNPSSDVTPPTEEEEAGPPSEDPQQPELDLPPPTPAPAAPEPAQPAPAPRPEDSIEYWKAKFSTLDGKYRAEVPRQAQQLREANFRIKQLEENLAKAAKATPEKSLVTQEEIEEYGEDFVSMMRRLAQEEAGRVVQTVAPKIEQVEGELQRTRAQTQAERVYALLDDQVEDWRTINTSQPFLSWLAEDDPYAGASRAVMLRDAFEQKDARRVLSFFQGFKSQQRVVDPPKETPQTPKARKVPLEQFAGPRASNNGATTSAPDSNVTEAWTRRQIAEFYKDVKIGVYRNDPDRQAAIERSISRAVAANLVTP